MDTAVDDGSSANTHKKPLYLRSTPTPLSSKPIPPLKKNSDFCDKGDIPTQAEQRRSDWRITKRLLVNVWPKNDWKTRWIVLLGFGLLVSSKVGLTLRIIVFFLLLSTGTQCSSAANIQGHRGFAQRGYNGIFLQFGYSLGR